MTVTMGQLNIKIFKCLAELNRLCSMIMNNEIQSSLRIFSDKETTYFEFSKFKDSVEDYRFSLEQFEKFKEYNLEHDITRSRLEQVTLFRDKAEIGITNAKRIINETKYFDFKAQFEYTIKTLVDSINIYMYLITDYLQENLKEEDYKNLVELYKLQDLKY